MTDMTERFSSPINSQHRDELLRETKDWYEQWASSGMCYEWYDTEEPWDDSGSLSVTYPDEMPSISEWLDQPTGEREPTFASGCGWYYRTFGDDVFRLAQETVWEAFEERYGENWRDDDDVDDLACSAETELYVWLETMLSRADPENRGRWQDEGF